MTRRASQRGSVSIVVAGVAVVALVASLGLADVGKALVARARARAAADAAALAAAQELALPGARTPTELGVDYADAQRRDARVVLVRERHARGDGRGRGAGRRRCSSRATASRVRSRARAIIDATGG